MNAHLYRNELKQNRTSFLVWAGLLAGLIILGMSFYPVLMEGETYQRLQGFVENTFVKNILDAMGMNFASLTNVHGFYAMRNGLFLLLIGSLYAVLLGGRLVAREEQEKTAEFLLTRPVTRSEVMAAKLAAMVTAIALLSLVIVFSGYAGLELFKGESSYRLDSFLRHNVYAFLLMQSFGAVGLFVSLLIKRGRPTNNLGVGIVSGAFFLEVLSRVSKSVDWIGYFSPFKFVDSDVLRAGYGLIWWRVLYFAGLTAGLWLLSFLLYRKKDILV